MCLRFSPDSLIKIENNIVTMPINTRSTATAGLSRDTADDDNNNGNIAITLPQSTSGAQPKQENLRTMTTRRGGRRLDING